MYGVYDVLFKTNGSVRISAKDSIEAWDIATLLWDREEIKSITLSYLVRRK